MREGLSSTRCRTGTRGDDNSSLPRALHQRQNPLSTGCIAARLCKSRSIFSMSVAVVPEALLRFERLLRQTYFAHQFGEPWVRTQWVELEVSVQTDQQPIVFPVSDVEPMERLVFVSQVGVEAGNDQRWVVASPTTLGLPEFNGFGESAFPACRAISLLNGGSEFRFALNSGESAVNLPFLDDLRVPAFSPVGVGQTIVRDGECRVLVRQLAADRKGFVVLPRRLVNASRHPADDERLRIELMREIDFRNGFLLPASDHGDLVGVPLACGGIVGVEFERLLELSLSPTKIPVILHLIAAQNGMRMSQRRV